MMMGIMKIKYISIVTGIVFCLSVIFTYNQGHTSDTCMFAVTADDLPPNIVFLLDNGVEMRHPVTHGDYDSGFDYTPSVVTQIDVVSDYTSGNGFFNAEGYSINVQGGWNYLSPVGSNLEINTEIELKETGGKETGIWTINDRTIILPTMASSAVDGDGVKDNAGAFRYSKNYLNWLFFYDGVDKPVYDGAALPAKSRFYYAKKALLKVGKLSSNKALFAIYNFANDAGASSVQGLDDVVDTLGATPEENILNSDYINNINNMGTVTYSPLAEGMATIGKDIGSPSFDSVDSTNYCQKTFVIVVSPGLSSQDKGVETVEVPCNLNDSLAKPGELTDEDGDGKDGFGDEGPGEGTITVDGQDYPIVTNYNGSTYMDDVAHYFYTNDMQIANDTTEATQIVSTYTVGFMATTASRLLLINTSNNGNGKTNLTNSAHPDYGKYHFDATSADGLSQAILDAVNSIISRTSSFTAPVVPVTRTTSGDKIYMAFFKPLDQNFWEGNVTKFGLSANNEIIGSNDQPATWPNGAMRQDAQPYWATIDWADTSKSNGIHNNSRNIYTYLGSFDDLTYSANRFATDNTDLTALILGNPADVTVNGSAVSGRDKVIQYIRGADVLDEDADGDSTENRAVITGDVLHSEPLVFTYRYADDSAETLVFFGANDGMLHAVLDISDPDINVSGDETHYGTEAWAFIPPNQLNRLKEIIEGSTHQDYVDSSPKIYFHDIDEDGRVDGDDGDKVILVCGLRKGGSGYFALDITDSDAPEYLWRIGNSNDAQTGTLELNIIVRYAGGTFQDGDTLALLSAGNSFDDAAVAAADEFGDVFVTFADRTRYFEAGDLIGNLTMAMYKEYLEELSLGPFALGRIVSVTTTDPDVVIPELAESWSEPQFGLVKTSDYDTAGTAVFFIGGGYSADNSAGNAVLAVNVLTGAVVKKFTASMGYSVASDIKVVDADHNGFVDKVYVGDLGGQMWRFGRFTDAEGNPLGFPDSDENISNWTAQVLFTAPTYTIESTTYTRKFFYPPSVTLEKGYDLLFTGTGDRENACDPTTAADRIYGIKDSHGTSSLTETDLVDVTDPAAAVPNLNQTDGDVDSNSTYDQGWFIRLVDNSGDSEVAEGEKVLGQGVAFYKTYYVTTFTPNDDACVPGGNAKLYAIDYLTGAAVIKFTDTDGDGEKDLTRSVVLGGGIPSKTVIVITQAGQKLFFSLGSTNPDADSKAVGAGIVGVDPLYPDRNFFYLWWRELLN
jgi:Tfp pilus tip-associated adhesin PilY1